MKRRFTQPVKVRKGEKKEQLSLLNSKNKMEERNPCIYWLL